MIHSNKHKRSSRYYTPRPMKSLLLLPVVGALLALSSCNDDEANKHTPPVTVTDTKPVGDGLAVIGFAMVAGCVVIVLGRLLR